MFDYKFVHGIFTTRPFFVINKGSFRNLCSLITPRTATRMAFKHFKASLDGFTLRPMSTLNFARGGETVIVYIRVPHGDSRFFPDQEAFFLRLLYVRLAPTVQQL